MSRGALDALDHVTDPVDRVARQICQKIHARPVICRRPAGEDPARLGPEPEDDHPALARDFDYGRRPSLGEVSACARDSHARCLQSVQRLQQARIAIVEDVVVRQDTAVY
jgi:GR25 family glycosyltransferase involved in LPS biosynthesis